VSPRARLIMAEIIPGITIFAVVLPDSAPLPLTQIGTPFFPGDSPLACLVQAFLLSDVYKLRLHNLPQFGSLLSTYTKCIPRALPVFYCKNGVDIKWFWQPCKSAHAF